MGDYRDLELWRRSKKLAVEIWKVAKSLPREETYVLGIQLKRSALSIPANIAEGWGRWGEKDFKRFLAIAMGSACELETHLAIALDLGYLKPEACKTLLSELGEIRRMLGAFIGYLKRKSAAAGRS
ncbi:MAG TPA: four helix bundle protein [Planctomycetota bacterium]|nr:four helix bundle protein [Planctomycetota bacterium]